MLLKGPVPAPVGVQPEQVHLIGADLPAGGVEGPPDAVAVLCLVQIDLPVHPPELIGGVHIEQEQSAGPQPAVYPPQRLPQVCRPGEVVQRVQGGDRRIHLHAQVQAGHGLVQEHRRLLQRRRLPGRLGQHLLGSVHGDHPVSPLRQQAGHGAGSAGQVQHRLHREGASVELPRQVVCPPAVFHIHCQGIVAGGQGVITAHLSRFLYRAKIFS